MPTFELGSPYLYRENLITLADGTVGFGAPHGEFVSLEEAGVTNANQVKPLRDSAYTQGVVALHASVERPDIPHTD